MPSLINELALAEIKRLVDQHPSLMLVDPVGLKSEESLALRRQLFGIGAVMRVAKARLIQRAVGPQAGKHLDDATSVAIICGKDIAAAARIIRDLAKDDKVKIRGGMIEGSALDAAGALRLADLPSKREAQAMVVKAIRAPLVKLARTLRAPVKRLGRALTAHKDKQPKG